MFSAHPKNEFLFLHYGTFILLSANALNLDQSKNVLFGKELIQEGHDGPGWLTRVIFPTIEFYIFIPLVQTCDPQGGASFDSKGII